MRPIFAQDGFYFVISSIFVQSQYAGFCFLVSDVHPSARWATTGPPGCRSALEWVLDQYKEKNPKDPTIREKFNNYRFSDHKEGVIDLLRRVCTVSVATMEIVDSMAQLENVTS